MSLNRDTSKKKYIAVSVLFIGPLSFIYAGIATWLAPFHETPSSKSQVAGAILNTPVLLDTEATSTLSVVHVKTPDAVKGAYM